jgi:hypothetical protein
LTANRIEDGVVEAGRVGDRTGEIANKETNELMSVLEYFQSITGQRTYTTDGLGAREHLRTSFLLENPSTDRLSSPLPRLSRRG